MNASVEEKIVKRAGIVTGVSSALGSWQICHTVCLGIVTMLGIIGITIAGMPLLFLTKIAKPVWAIAVAIFIIVVYMAITKKCISRKIILLNAGLLIIGTPFVPKATPAYYTIGGTLATIAIILFLKDVLRKKSGALVITGILSIAMILFLVTLEARVGMGDAKTISSASGSASISPARSYSAQTTGTTGSGDVEITLTPKYNNGKLEVSTAVNTHSVDISQYDLAKISVLSYNGKNVYPTSAPTLTGHHSNGVLIYNIADNLKSFQITITGIPQTKIRKYEWR